MKKTLFFILSGMVLLIANIPVVEARDSTAVLPAIAQPGGITFLSAGVTAAIYANSNVPTQPATFNTVPATIRCPANTTPSITISFTGLSGYPTPLGFTQHFRYIALNCSTALDANYRATCTNAFGVWANDDGSAAVFSGLNVGWTIYCGP